MIIFLIILIIAMCGTAFLLHFCYDTVHIWGNNLTKELLQPSLSDLIEEESEKFSKADPPEEIERKQRINEIVSYNNERKRREYVEKIISPSYYYLKLLKAVELANNITTGENVAFFILPLYLILFTSKILFKLNVSEKFWLCTIIALLTCVFVMWVSFVIYKKTPLAIKKYNEDLLRLEERLSIEYDNNKASGKLEHNISKRHFVNNCIIENHSKYIFSIKETCFFRAHTRKTLNIIATIIYFLFFFRLPEYYL